VAVAGGPVAELLRAHPGACDAVASLLGCEGGWLTEEPAAHAEAVALLARHPETALAVAGLVAPTG
ncbi:hypothetical protein, partial [Nonomuraea sp. NPDC005501]